MCGIFGVHGLEQPTPGLRTKAIALSKRLRHRGPDWSGCYVGKECILAHERLAIVGVGEPIEFLSPYPLSRNVLNVFLSQLFAVIVKFSA